MSKFLHARKDENPPISTKWKIISPAGSRLLFGDIGADNVKLAKIIADKYKKCITNAAQFNDSPQENVDEQCIISGSKNKEQVTKPIGPANNRKWLSNVDIHNVMDPWVEVYSDINTGPKFIFFGPYTRDFKELNCEIAIRPMKDLVRKKYTVIATIINYDDSSKGGSHWVAVTIIVPRKYVLKNDTSEPVLIYFWDSTGNEDPPNPSDYEKNAYDSENNPIKEFLEDVKSQFEQLGLKAIMRGNPHEHQQKDTECGIYTILFILAMLHGVDFDEFIERDDLSDENVYKLRKIFFRTS
jgi:hypothetical protein